MRSTIMNAFNKVISFYDTNIVKLFGWKHLPNSETNFLFFVPKTYKGEAVTLDDGVTIQKGDRILEIHIDNANLKNLDTNYSSIFIMLKDELISLGKLLPQKGYEDYKAVLAVTLLYHLGERAGFTVFDIEDSLKRKMVSVGENILRSALRKEKEDKEKKAKKRIAKKCLISRDKIFTLERYDMI